MPGSKKKSGKHGKGKHGASAHQNGLNGQASQPATTQRRTIRVDVGPDTLQTLGPHVLAEWAWPSALSFREAALGHAVPPPIAGLILIDTGAMSTSIAEEVAEELGLKAVDTQTVYGAAGPHAANKYFARFRLGLPDPNGGPPHFIDTELLTTGVRDMQKLYDAMGVKLADGSPVRPIGLLGRDFLRFSRLTYHGTDGRFELAVALPSPAKHP